MSNQLRMTGLFSGLDTESIVSALVSAKATKVTTLKQDQEKLKWKQNIWQSLNSKVYSFYTGNMSNMRLSGSYSLKSTKSSDSTKATVVAGESAVNGTQKLEIKKLASSGYLTGAKLSKSVTDEETGVTTLEDGKFTAATKLTEIAGEDIAGKKISVKGSKDGEAKEIEITSGMTVKMLVSQLKEAGVNANFDEKNQRFFINSTSSGADGEFTLADVDATGTDGALYSLGLLAGETYANGSEATRQVASDAEIVLNGATFTSSTNTFTINGLTITANAITDEPITITTETDYDGIYDMIKDMFSEYNDIINDVYKRYNADSARDYAMLSDDEKESMSDEQVETWEDKIKDSLLRRDKDLGTIMNTLTSTMSAGYEVNGKKMYLSDFGIGTLSYFDAEEGERKAYHIDGDPDDENTSSNEDKLKAAIASDPDKVISFFTQLCDKMYNDIGTVMKRSEYRSVYKIYDDKQLQSDYDDYNTKIANAQKKLEEYEDKWYAKFSDMEVALSKIQSNSNTITNMLGN